MTQEWRRGAFLISTDRTMLDLTMIHAFLRESYWASGVPFEVVQRSVEHSLPFGLYEDGRQIGFARVITDYATFAYIGDVFVLPSYRGQGLGKWLVEVIIDNPRLQGLRRWILATADAHGLYQQYGFTGLARPANYMEKHDPDVYRR